ncbi:hypothetical protein Mterra_00100 [Calidithermus terrae]|uniref:Uncharacterized protein n=1 Tax=Calidithermus terrae TaxID=1408545 RepID=A0A399F5E9_9DEIN|nr:hypothetical protein [Calidithermus terrae]RIH90876.1 hypothetical protein Mterra_00100 [Calidithermus terrae]
MPEMRKYPQLALRLEHLRSILEAGLADALLSALHRAGEGGEPFLVLKTASGTLMVPLCLEPVDL